VADDAQLIKQFERALRRGVQRCQKLGYNPTYFIQMLDERGAVGAARQLLAAPAVSEGFTRLWELGHLELTVEAIVVDGEYEPLFTPTELKTARRRLDELR
jgi:hypothetical protein